MIFRGIYQNAPNVDLEDTFGITTTSDADARKVKKRHGQAKGSGCLRSRTIEAKSNFNYMYVTGNFFWAEADSSQITRIEFGK